MTQCLSTKTGQVQTTRRAAFLAEMERVVPWSALCELIAPVYPKPGNGRPPVGVERMLRIYFLQQWFNLSDPAVEEALYDSLAMRRFVGIDLGREPVPDETTVCRFRHLLKHGGTLEKAAAMANHGSTSATQLYDPKLFLISKSEMFAKVDFRVGRQIG